MSSAAKHTALLQPVNPTMESDSHANRAGPASQEALLLQSRSVAFDSDSSHSVTDHSDASAEGPSTPDTTPSVNGKLNVDADEKVDHDVNGIVNILSDFEFDGDAAAPRATTRPRRASTVQVTSDSDDARALLGDIGASTHMVEKACCGGGCCMVKPLRPLRTMGAAGAESDPVRPPHNNRAYDCLRLRLDGLLLGSELTDVLPLPEKTVFLDGVPTEMAERPLTPADHPPRFVQPHAPYDVYRAPVRHARELTKPGAEKRTYHFDIDVSDYPEESGGVDFVVGGAIGLCPRNSDEMVDEVFGLLGIPKFVRDRKVLLQTTKGRWPTIWGEDKPRRLLTTRRELLTWCSDLQSYPPTKQLFRLMAEYTTDPHEQKILFFLASAQGQGSFCDLRTESYITVPQILHAFPSSRPPLDHLLSVLNALMPRFYSLSHDPLLTASPDGHHRQRLIEFAVTVHEMPEYQDGTRSGVASGFLERVARGIIDYGATDNDEKTDNSTNQHQRQPPTQVHLPIFRGLMANPLAREFASDGPMLLVGAGVGVAPFRGFVQRRLRAANCANKVWVLQGVRDSLLDELYSGEWGVHEEQIKRVVQSRRGGEGRKYVQEEVRAQADLVWFVINALDGRVFVCGSSRGMGEGVEAALVDVAMAKGKLNKKEAEEFWRGKMTAGQYIAVSGMLSFSMYVANCPRKHGDLSMERPCRSHFFLYI